MLCKTTSTNLTIHTLQSPSTLLTPLSPSSSERHNCLLKSALLNTCSIRNKIPLILELAVEHDLDLIFITETWIMPDDIPLISSLNTGPYSFSHLPRRNTHNYGGGIGIIFKSSLHVFPLRDHNNDHSESFTCSISPPHSKTFNISLFYRPPSSSIPLFLSEFYSFTHLMSESNIIIGDFNIATNLSTNHSKSLLNILSSSNLKLHNTYPTHKYGNTLDLLISHKSSNLICSHSVGPYISDHHIIFFTLQSLKPPHPTITRSFRKTKIINTHDFIRDFLSLPHNSPDELFTTLSSTLDSHAPIIIKKSILRLDTSWYTLALLKQKRKLRTL